MAYLTQKSLLIWMGFWNVFVFFVGRLFDTSIYEVLADLVFELNKLGPETKIRLLRNGQVAAIWFV